MHLHCLLTALTSALLKTTKEGYKLISIEEVPAERPAETSMNFHSGLGWLIMVCWFGTHSVEIINKVGIERC